EAERGFAAFGGGHVNEGNRQRSEPEARYRSFPQVSDHGKPGPQDNRRTAAIRHPPPHHPLLRVVGIFVGKTSNLSVGKPSPSTYDRRSAHHSMTQPMAWPLIAEAIVHGANTAS